MLGTWEIILIALAVLLIFGGKKIPELMKGIGKGMRSFREGVEGKEDKENNDEKVEEAGNER
jgi:sec-independent protein translocase protein TatA